MNAHVIVKDVLTLPLVKKVTGNLSRQKVIGMDGTTLDEMMSIKLNFGIHTGIPEGEIRYFDEQQKVIFPDRASASDTMARWGWASLKPLDIVN